jgi:hypothetical protein
MPTETQDGTTPLHLMLAWGFVGTPWRGRDPDRLNAMKLF